MIAQQFTAGIKVRPLALGVREADDCALQESSVVRFTDSMVIFMALPQQ